MVENLLSIDNGTFHWRGEDLVGYTHHVGGRIQWARAATSRHEALGDDAVLMIAAGRNIACAQIASHRTVNNMTMSWEELTEAVTRQMHFSRRFHRLYPQLSDLWVRRTGLQAEEIDAAAQVLYAAIGSQAMRFDTLRTGDGVETLTILIHLEMAGLIRLTIPERISVA